MDSKFRVIILLDADAFEYQLWKMEDMSLNPEDPTIIVNSSNKIVAVNYPARNFTIKRSDKIAEAKIKCDNLVVKVIPDRYGKPDQRTPRLAGYKLHKCVAQYRKENNSDMIIQFASKDEFLLDVTNYVGLRLQKMEGEPSSSDFYGKTIIEADNRIAKEDLQQDFWTSMKEDRQLLMGSIIAKEIIEMIKANTGFQMSAGIAENQIRAKLACGLNKPAAVTVLTNTGLERVADTVKIEDITSLGGKMGQKIKVDYGVSTMKQLQNIEEIDLVQAFGEKKGSLVFALERGKCEKVVREQAMFKTVSVGKKIFGRRTFKTEQCMLNTLKVLCEEMKERLDDEINFHNRRAEKMKIQIKRRLPPSQTHHNLPVESGSFALSNNVNASEIFKKSKAEIQKNWDHNQPLPVSDIIDIALIGKDFISEYGENNDLTL